MAAFGSKLLSVPEVDQHIRSVQQGLDQREDLHIAAASRGPLLTSHVRREWNCCIIKHFLFILLKMFIWGLNMCTKVFSYFPEEVIWFSACFHEFNLVNIFQIMCLLLYFKDMCEYVNEAISGDKLHTNLISFVFHVKIKKVRNKYQQKNEKVTEWSAKCKT